MLERNVGVALWRQIEGSLADEIAGGILAPGTQLPTEHDLAERFAVNRHTVRRAIGALVERGLVRVEQGRGTFVLEHVIDYLVGKRTRFSEIVTRQNRSPGGRLRSLERVPADQASARALAIREGDPIWQLDSISEVDGRPVSLGTHRFPAVRFPDFREVYMGTGAEAGSITRTLTHFGCGDYTRRTTRLTARMPDATETDLLQMPRSRPLMVSESVNVDGSGRPIEYGLASYAADRVQFVFET